MLTKQETTAEPVDKVLPLEQLIILGFQHVCVMCAGAVAVPLVIGSTLNLPSEQIIFLINAVLLAAGVATLAQALGIKDYIGIKAPIVEGASFVAVPTMVAIANTYQSTPEKALTTIFGGTIVAGVFCFLIAPFFSKLIKFFPKVVTGSVITIMGISLLPVAIRWSAGNDASSPDFASIPNIILALFVLVSILVMYKFFKGFLGNITILLGMALGTVVAWIMGMADFSMVADTSWFNINTPLYFGMPNFDFTAVFSMVLAMLVMMIGATGNIIAICEITGKKLDDKKLTKAMRSEGLVTILSGTFNSFPISVFGQNVGLVSMTNVTSRFAVAAAGVILIVLGLFPKMGALVASIPYPVLGGASIAMFGMVVSGGIRSLGDVDYEGNKNAMIVAVSIGLSLIPLVVPDFYHAFPEWVNTLFGSGITTGSIAAILLNLFFNELGKGN